MRLTDLQPHWTTFADPSANIRSGITFQCPHCKTQRLGVLFANPIDPDKWLEKGITRPHAQCEWHREGETFDTLTLTPSVDASRIDVGGHWHGFITNGEIQ